MALGHLFSNTDNNLGYFLFSWLLPPDLSCKGEGHTAPAPLGAEKDNWGKI